MNVKFFRWLFLFVILTLIIIGFISGPETLGASIELSDGNYLFAGGTDPLALVLSAVTLGLYLLLIRSSSNTLHEPLPGVFRRYLAFWLDFIIAMAIATPIIGLIPLLAEWKRTHIFQWRFVRTYPTADDKFILIAVFLLTFPALVFYYMIPLIRSKPSPGSCITGYQIVTEDRTRLTPRTSLLRMLLGFVAVAGWFLAPFVGRDRKRGKFWLDKVFKTQAVKVS